MSVLDERPTSTQQAVGPLPGTDGTGLSSSTSVGPTPPGVLAFHCQNCITDWPEPFCDECGAPLWKKQDPAAHLPGSAAGSQHEGA